MTYQFGRSNLRGTFRNDECVQAACSSPTGERTAAMEASAYREAGSGRFNDAFRAAFESSFHILSRVKDVDESECVLAAIAVVPEPGDMSHEGKARELPQ
jgi:hypothetical protein